MRSSGTATGIVPRGESSSEARKVDAYWIERLWETFSGTTGFRVAAYRVVLAGLRDDAAVLAAMLNGVVIAVEACDSPVEIWPPLWLGFPASSWRLSCQSPKCI